MKAWAKVPLLAMVVLTSLPLAAHELQSVVLRLDEAPGGMVRVLLKTPLSKDGRPAAVVPRFPNECLQQDGQRVSRETDFVIREWHMLCSSGLSGTVIRIEGLDPRTPDAVVTARFSSGQETTLALDRHGPEARLLPASSAAEIEGLSAYLWIGIEHILLGPDHLLFVLGLMLLVAASLRTAGALVLSLTAFTLAHSVTLAVAVLGIWGLPPKPVEILIALSIVLVALELAAHPRRLAAGLSPSLSMRKPWLVAFAFGLLHGFGFAGALAQVGLPEYARGWALLLFNLGVELGQLLFVALLMVGYWLLRRLPIMSPGRVHRELLVLGLGGMAMYWVLDRLWLWSATLVMGFGT